VRFLYGQSVKCFQVIFKSTETPRESVIGTIKQLPDFKRNLNFEIFVLVNDARFQIVNFESIVEGDLLTFHIPEKLSIASGNEWTYTQLSELKIEFEDVDIVKFFSFETTKDEFDYNTSERGLKLEDLLKNINMRIEHEYSDLHSIEKVRADEMLQHPITKALFTSLKYENYESNIDHFMIHLLNEMGFNEGSLYVFPQMRMNLLYGDQKAMATADFTILDLLSFARIVIVEDKNVKEMRRESDSTPQLVAEGIALAQYNYAIEQKTKKRKALEELTTIYGIRVTGHFLNFYVLPISSEIQLSMDRGVLASTTSKMFRYQTNSQLGLNFLDENERSVIIRILSILQKIAKQTGEMSDRRDSLSSLKVIK